MTLLEGNEKIVVENNAKIAVYVPFKTFNSLRKEFNILESEVDGFVTSLIERSIMERAGDANSNVFSKAEEKELEDDLRGLGYL